MDSRRNFIKKAALLSGGVGFLNMLPPAVQKALAINPAPGSTWQDAEHIVLLMQENRSFDHCFGTLQGVRGFNDPRAITLPGGNKVWLQTNTTGETYTPFRLNIKDTKATWMSSLPHSWHDQVDARNDGKFNRWLDVKKPGNEAYKNIPMTMGYYTREDLPFYYAMADAFTICDQHFCSSLTGTTPNRLFFWTGTLREDEKSKARVRNSETDYGTEAAWKTFPERLEENGVSWKIYQNEVSVGVGFEGEEDAWLANFTDNPLEWFTQFKVKLSKGYINYLKNATPLLTAKKTKLENISSPLNDEERKKIDEQLKWIKERLLTVEKDKLIYTKEKYDQLSPFQKNLHDKAFTTNIHDPFYHELTTIEYEYNNEKQQIAVPKGDVLHQFRQDVTTGNLPTVSWIVAPENFCDHPSAPWYGAWYISEVMDILTQNPEVWKKTIFILTYDENDGCFDHVPPFIPPHPTKQNTGVTSAGIDTSIEYVHLEDDLKYSDKEEARGGPVGLGYRVPMLIASPWSRGGAVCSEVFDHTSALQFLETFLNKKLGKNIAETNISKWRRTVCGDLSSVFQPYNGEKITVPATPAKDAFIEDVHRAKFKDVPSNYKKLSQQEIELANNNPAASPYMPQQEKGIRTACALPYELYADGKLSDDKKSFEIIFKAGNNAFGKQSAGAPFHVYNYSKVVEDTATRAYATAAGETIKDAWPLHHFNKSGYHLCVYGPNGFFRAFKGNSNDPLAYALCVYETAKGSHLPTGNIAIQLLNGNKQTTIEIIDNAYKTGPQTKLLHANEHTMIIIDLSKSFGWYDFSVKVKGNETFEKRYAGHVETGKASYSDPLMGGMV